MRAVKNPRPKQMDPISIPLCPRARVAQAAGARPSSDELMSQFCLLGAGFIDPEISPADCQVCRDRSTGEISGLARRRASVIVVGTQRPRVVHKPRWSEAQPR